MSANSGITYIRMTDASPLAGHTLAERGLPDGVIVVSVRRGDGKMGRVAHAGPAAPKWSSTMTWLRPGW